VTAGQPIGLVGSSGNSSGAHLHLEVEVRTILDRDESGVTVERRQGLPIWRTRTQKVGTHPGALVAVDRLR
jgi:murein DD-endopeptidase MepM/ murein hydrolase activator NlpD